MYQARMPLKLEMTYGAQNCEKRLRVLSETTLERLVSARLAMASALCLLAGSQLLLDDSAAATLTIKRIREIGVSLRSLADRHGVMVETELLRLESRAVDLESRILDNHAPPAGLR